MVTHLTWHLVYIILAFGLIISAFMRWNLHTKKKYGGKYDGKQYHADVQCDGKLICQGCQESGMY